MIRAVIIEDEQHCADRLISLIERYCKDQVHVMDTFYSVDDGLNGIKKFKPDLVLLDVQIGERTGFDLLKSLSSINFHIIFTTAYDQYAVQAFKFSAVDYLLKPVDGDDLKSAVEKLMNRNLPSAIPNGTDNLLHNLGSEKSKFRRLAVPVLNGLQFLEVQDIIRCQSDGNYTTFFLKDKKKLTVARTLKDFEELLSDSEFYRVHNSHLINLNYIKSYNKGKGGYVTLSDNSEIEVSTRRKDDFLKRITQ